MSNDSASHPDHYTRGDIECKDAIRAAISDLPGYEAWIVGNIIAYLWRYRWKGTAALDIEKVRELARWLAVEVEKGGESGE